jgi:hypothetical protein
MDYFEFNFNTFKVTQRDTQIFNFTKDAEGGQDVPDSEYAYKASFGNGFFKRDSNQLNMIGISPSLVDIPFSVGFQFDSPIAHVITPLKLNDRYQDETTSEKEYGILNLKIKISVEYHVNGYGKITTPEDSTFDVIRLWRKFKWEVKSTPIFGDPEITIDSLITWEYYNNDVKNTILRVDSRPTGSDSIWHFDFFVEDLTVYTGTNQHQQEPINKSSLSSVKIDNLNDIESMGFKIIEAYDIEGKRVDINNISQKGFYIFILTNPSNGSVSYSKLYLYR